MHLRPREPPSTIVRGFVGWMASLVFACSLASLFTSESSFWPGGPPKQEHMVVDVHKHRDYEARGASYRL